MMHSKDAYDRNENALHPEKLREVINKYFFLNNSELEYDEIEHSFF